MKAFQQLLGMIQAFLAKSLVWGLIAFLACIPLGLVLLNVFDSYVDDNEAFEQEIQGRIDLLFLVFAITCFVGVVLIRMLAVSIKIMVEKQQAPKK